jgi:hypothetical protein
LSSNDDTVHVSSFGDNQCNVVERRRGASRSRTTGERWAVGVQVIPVRTLGNGMAFNSFALVASGENTLHRAPVTTTAATKSNDVTTTSVRQPTPQQADELDAWCHITANDTRVDCMAPRTDRPSEIRHASSPPKPCAARTAGRVRLPVPSARRGQPPSAVASLSSRDHRGVRLPCDKHRSRAVNHGHRPRAPNQQMPGNHWDSGADRPQTLDLGR